MQKTLQLSIVGGNLVSNPNQVLSSSELAARDAGLILKVLLNPTLGKDASHPCLISTWPKEGCTIMCVIPEKVSKTAVHCMHYALGEGGLIPKRTILDWGSRLSFLPQ